MTLYTPKIKCVTLGSFAVQVQGGRIAEGQPRQRQVDSSLHSPAKALLSPVSSVLRGEGAPVTVTLARAFLLPVLLPRLLRGKYHKFTQHKLT